MFAHPHCPCTRASLGELALIMARFQGKLDAHVLFYRPADLKAEWSQTDTLRTAASIPGVTVSEDLDGSEAAVFHAVTSGQVLLYDAHGHWIFEGGITESRGHAGDNDGRDAIIALLTSGTARYHTTPAFGCSIQDERSRR
jgi:hypothetical protein